MEGRKLTLIQSGEFLGTKCDFYVDEKEFVYMTREQIGQALEYANPRVSMSILHERNAKRLNKYSTVIEIMTVEGKRKVSRKRVMYFEQGIYEVVRFSRQPIADDFYDWVYDQLESIRRTGGSVIRGREGEFIDNDFPSFTEKAKLVLAKELERVVKEQEEKIKKLTPKAKNWDIYMNAEGYVTMAKLAKALNIKNIGRNNLFKVLRQRDVLRTNNEPYQRYVNAGYFKVVTTEKNGKKFIQTLITGKGMEWVSKKMEHYAGSFF